jgi:hypothetical protein
MAAAHGLHGEPGNEDGRDDRTAASSSIRARSPRSSSSRSAFKRNDQLLGALPISVVVFAGSRFTDNLADKGKATGIPLFDCRKAGSA